MISGGEIFEQKKSLVRILQLTHSLKPVQIFVLGVGGISKTGFQPMHPETAVKPCDFRTVTGHRIIVTGRFKVGLD